MPPLLCAVDVGSRSARAAIVTGQGALLGRGESPIALDEPRRDHMEQDSEEIWRAVCLAVRSALASSGKGRDDVVGIAFDATCSVVLRDRKGRPLPVSSGNGPARDTIVWIDHRALDEAAAATATGHAVVGLAGGALSPEMAVPKMMWLKRHQPEAWAEAGYFFDLADFLAWRACGSNERSQCTLACKWTFVPESGGWQADFLAAVGLQDMIARGGLPRAATPPGTRLGTLLPDAAQELGLTTSCCVAAGLVDAYAGALGILGPEILAGRDPHRHLALVAGTSSCVMAMTSGPRAITGCWGPYKDVVLSGIWMIEGGQSATGALLDHIVRIHGAGGEPSPARHRAIIERIGVLRAEQGEQFGRRLHVLPDFHGNRTPFARPDALGVISGLALDASFDGLCALYWRCCVAIALGVRHILETFAEAGVRAETLYVTGGHTRNRLLIELYADATGCAIAEAVEEEAVLTGTAMLAAAGAGLHASLSAACLAMRQPLRITHPDPARKARLETDYRIFLEMHRQRDAIESMTASFGA